MTQIGNAPAIKDVKLRLKDLQGKGLIKEWEIPYEHTLTRLDAAILFLTPAQPPDLGKVWEELETYSRISYRVNEEKKLSQLEWRVEFHDEY